MKNKRTLKTVGEFGLIGELRKKFLPAAGVIKSIGDDTAVVEKDRNTYLLFTTDMIVEGVHFKKEDAFTDIGYKALAVNVSDIAAMGGLPKWAVISLGISPEKTLEDIRQLYRGIEKCARGFGVCVVGGDTVRSSRTIVNVTLTGETGRKEVVFRDGAKIGDGVFVTGPLGGSLKSKRHLRFTPRVEEARFLVTKFKPTAMIDISDGLAADLGHIMRESGVGAELAVDDIPVHRGASLKQALYDGEDFELLFTLPQKTAERLRKLRPAKWKFYEIGRIVEKKRGLCLIDGKGRLRPLAVKGYTHF